MKRAERPSAVRILPPDGTQPEGATVLGPDSRKQWRGPGAIVGIVLAVFLVSTRPSGTADNPDNPSLAPPLAAFEIETVDLIEPPLTIEAWTPASLDTGTQINTILRHSSILAIGSSEGEPQAWVSGNGSTWRPSIDIEEPDRPAESIDHAVYWGGAAIALSAEAGTAGVWRSRTVGNWQYHGSFSGLRSGSIAGLAGGEQLLALESLTDGVQGWTSADGQEWTNLGSLDTLSDVSINSVDATEQWYYVGGRNHLDLVAGKPVVYRSPDGLTWEPVDGEGAGVLSTATGEVTALTAHDGTVYASGWTIEPDGVVVAVWRSEDGLQWERVGAESPALRPTTVTLQALSADSSDAARAAIVINGRRHWVAAGFELVTNDGTFVVEEVQAHLVEVRIGDDDIFLHRGDSPTELVLSGRANDIAVEGPRIVLAGSMDVGGLIAPALWTSTNRGVTWERSTIPNTVGELTDIVITGPNIAALGGTGTEPAIWRTSWNTQPMVDHAGAIATRYVHALNARDLPALVGLLPSATETVTAPQFAVPALGSYRQRWWNPDSGTVDAELVSETLDYLDGIGAQIELGECATGVRLGTSDRATVTCEFSVTSTMLTTLNIAGQGRLRAMFADSVFEGVVLDQAPTNDAWELLVAGIGGAPVAEQQTLIWYDDDEQRVVEPVFNASSADAHNRLASRLVAGLLGPDDIRTVDTELGAMEWQWIAQEDGDLGHFSSIAWNHSGFLAVAHDRFSDAAPAVLRSEDGIDWSEVEIPPDVWGLHDLQAFGAGWVAQAWKPDEPVLMFFDGFNWTEISLLSEGGDGFADMAVSGDQILAVIAQWSGDGVPDSSRAVLIGPDLIAAEVSMPADYDWSNHNLGLAGNENGFLLAMENSYQPATLTVWHTADGNSWTVVSELTPIDDAMSVFNMHGHQSQYFVVGQTLQRRCTRTAEGDICNLPLGIWTSPDGKEWDRLITRNGDTVSAYSIGASELGLVAVGSPYINMATPSLVYISIDGAPWRQLGDLSIYVPGVDWWDINNVAVGNDTIVISGAYYVENTQEPTQSSFLVVGRLVDP